ncbi:MAG: hypothetical protein EA363_01420 [Balneolaceae bacterium]|nr:MAG: hypothetical protein EA363_01420 [Balneolaceae bacterium]
MKKNLFTAFLFLFLFLSIDHLAAQEQARYSNQTNNAPTSESFQSTTFNGAWCWFSDHRAVYS